MKLLFITSQVPMPSFAASARAFYLLKYLSPKYGHQITLLSLSVFPEASSYVVNLEPYCEDIHAIPLLPEVDSGLSFKGIKHTIKNMLSPQNILSRHPCLFNFRYSPEMQRRARELLRSNKFDLIYVNGGEIIYCIHDTDLPKVLEIQSLDSLDYYQYFKHEKNFPKKMVRLFQYYQYRHWEEEYQRFDACISLSTYDTQVLKARLPNLNITVVPPGVDTDYFNPMSLEPDFPSLIFVGSFQVQQNVEAILYFYNEIYPTIRNAIPDVKLYVVGRKPPREVARLTENSSIVVTGYVDDVRPYLARASVVVIPLLTGSGVTTKVQEAMAMGKPIVSTSISVRGLDMPLEGSIIIADDSQTFAAKVVELLNDEQQRHSMGMNALSLVRSKYSWQTATDRVNDVFQEVVRQRGTEDK